MVGIIPEKAIKLGVNDFLREQFGKNFALGLGLRSSRKANFV
jgi:hypothetical protein